MNNETARGNNLLFLFFVGVNIRRGITEAAHGASGAEEKAGERIPAFER